MPSRPVLGALLLFALATPALAAPATGTVEGDIAAPTAIAPPEWRYLGFIDQPIVNPITEPRPYDPLPDVFVFLEGGPAAPDAAQPPRDAVVWALGSHAFSPPLLPIVTGTTVELSNQGRETHLLVSPDANAVLPKDPIGPGSSRQVTITGNRVIRVTSRDVPHLEGRIVPVPTRYFARVNRDGTFKIADVPHGDWTLRVWYRDRVIAKTLNVSVGNRTLRQKIELPADLDPKPAAEAAPAGAPAKPR